MVSTNRLLIKPLNCNELQLLINNQDLLSKQLGLSLPDSLTNPDTFEAIKKDLLPNMSHAGDNADFYSMWIVIERNLNEIIGGLCFHGAPDNKKTVEIGYGIDAPYRMKGYATELVNGIILWCYNTGKIDIIVAETDDDNIASKKVLINNGFEFKDGLFVLQLIKYCSTHSF